MGNGELKTCEIKNIGKIDTGDFERLSELLSAFSNKVRLAIIDSVIKHGELCACELETATGLSQPTITSHLRRMYGTGILMKNEIGKYTYYSINTKFRDLIEKMLSFRELPA